MNYLKIKLQAPMMYFCNKNMSPCSEGTDSYSHLAPTKDMLVGLLGCCLGYERGSKELQDLKDNLPNCYWASATEDGVDKSYRFFDFKRINRYMNTHFKQAKNGKDKDVENLIKRVQFLCNANFDVYIGGTEEELHRYYEAIRNPHWIPYLGKFECPITNPLVTNEIEIKEDISHASLCL